MLAALRAEAGALAGPMGLACIRAVPRIDGSLYLEFEPGGLRLDWRGPCGPPLEGMVGGARATALARELEPRLEAALARPEFGLLAFRNQELPELAFDRTVVDTLLADCLAPGRTRWFDYAFEQVFQEAPGAFRLSFRGRLAQVEFEVRRADLGGAGQVVLQNHVLVLAVLADDRSLAQRRLVPHQVERFLGFLLSRSVHPGMRPAPEPSRPGSRPGPEGDDRAPVSITRWGNPRQWRQFFADFEIERSGLCGVQFTDPVAFVLHGEAECIGVEPSPSTPLMSFANLPWPEERVRSPRGSRSFFTGLVEEDAILGATPKLERALAAALETPGARLVCLNNTCLPKIIGDDASSVIRRLTRADRPPILDMNTDLDAPDKTYRDLVRQALEAAASQVAARESAGEGRLNLVGHPLGPGREELARELERLGLQVNTWLLPEFGLELLGRFLGAPRGLVYPHAPWWTLAEEILGETGVALTRAPSPHGLAGTRAWLEAALQATGLSPERLTRWEQERLEPARDRWEALAREASEHVLGFVVDPSEWPRLFAPERLYGVSVLPLLVEMGFRVEVLLLAQGQVFGRASEELRARGELADRVRLETFEDQAGLEAALQVSPAAAFYSEVRFDSRLPRAGKALFHLGFFEPGLDGGLRSLERLLGLCRWPFYRRYASYLEAADRP